MKRLKDKNGNYVNNEDYHYGVKRLGIKLASPSSTTTSKAIREVCSNLFNMHDGGLRKDWCIAYEKVCPQMYSEGIVCDYYKIIVLPTIKKADPIITRSGNIKDGLEFIKTCKGCNESFKTLEKRQLYCSDECKRKNYNKRKREARNKKKA